jgi:hypothetical protein
MSSLYDDFSKSDHYVCAPGENCDRTLDYRARSIQVDNLSNSWLYVPALNKYIPPLTINWSQIFPTPTNHIIVNTVPGPLGGITSQNTGDNVVIDVFGWVAATSSSGVQLGSITAQSQQSQILVSAQQYTIGSGVNSLIAGIPNKSINIVGWNIAYLIGPLPPAGPPTGRYHVNLFSNTGLQALLQDGSLQFDVDLYPYGIQLVAGDDLFIDGHSDDASTPIFFNLVRYYIGEP